MGPRAEEVRADPEAAADEQRRLLAHRARQRLAPDPAPADQRQGQGEEVPRESAHHVQAGQKLFKLITSRPSLLFTNEQQPEALLSCFSAFILKCAIRRCGISKKGRPQRGKMDLF